MRKKYNEDGGLIILKALVGSRAHGLEREDSDYDYRGVYVVPTSKLLDIGIGKVKDTHWIEGDVDNTSYEIGHFLKLATHSNPSILETMLAQPTYRTEDGENLQRLFGAVWNAKNAYEAFLGYGHNQMKKMVENKEGRWQKYAKQHLLVLRWFEELMRYGAFTINVRPSAFKNQLVRIRDGKVSMGVCLDLINAKREDIKDRWDRGVYQYKDKQTDLVLVNQYLLDLRHKFFWEV